MNVLNRLKPCAAAALVLLIAVPAWAEGPTTRPTTSPTTAPAGGYVVPLEVMTSGHLAVMAKINGRGPYRFVFDTGAPMLLIGEKVAKLSGVLGPKFRRPFFTMMGNLGAHDVKSIDLNGAQQVNGQTDVWDHPTVKLLANEEGPLEGIIGFPFFARFRTTIDYKAHTLTLSPTGYVPVDVRKQLEQRMSGDDGPATIAPAVSLGVRVAKDGRDPRPGVVVTAVAPNGPAADAGVMIGDRLLTLDGRWTDAANDVYQAAAGVDPAAKTIPATLTREGRPMAVDLAVKRGI